MSQQMLTSLAVRSGPKKSKKAEKVSMVNPSPLSTTKALIKHLFPAAHGMQHRQTCTQGTLYGRKHGQGIGQAWISLAE